jgi:demethylmenaquinone methyltransferase/2-methoxy-6-polyprenyl-1,4-benzoquinol methylase
MDMRRFVFDKIALYWDKRPLPENYQQKAEKITLSAVKASQKVILDIGSGTGGLLPTLLQTDPAQVYAVDFSFGMLSEIKAKFNGNEKLKIIGADTHSLPFPDDFADAVICHGVVPHFRSYKEAFAEIARVLKPDGYLAIAHSIGREKVNQIHGGHKFELLRKDILPSAKELSLILEKYGWKVLESEDQPDFYLLAAQRK